MSELNGICFLAFGHFSFGVTFAESGSPGLGASERYEMAAPATRDASPDKSKLRSSGARETRKEKQSV
jgi:hypothetical protein